MKTVNSFEVKRKSILLRVDFNVPLNARNNISDDFRIRKSLPTIRYLVENGARVIIVSHLGRPRPIFDKGKSNVFKSEDYRKYSLRKVGERLEKLLGREVFFIKQDLREKGVKEKIEKFPFPSLLMLENLRFYKGEEENDGNFSKNLARLGDIFINDAFSVCHRDHASIVGITNYLPSGAGFLLEDEIKHLTQIKNHPVRPLTCILGGIKIDTKIKFINAFLGKVDYLILGGEIVRKILDERIKGEKYNLSERTVQEINKIDLESRKLVLPEDVIVKDKDGKTRKVFLNNIKESQKIFDIGQNTVSKFSRVINKSQTIFWNGPLGYIEKKKFSSGSLGIAEAIIKNGQYSVIGGGDTLAFLKKYKLRDKFSYVSTGGGAMLSFLAGERLPGIEALK